MNAPPCRQGPSPGAEAPASAPSPRQQTDKGGDLAAVCLVCAEAAIALPTLFSKTAGSVFLRQVYFTGIEALPLLATAALAGGWLSMHQLFGVLGRDMGLAVEVFRQMVVQEGAAILVSLFVLARSGAATASEIANMRLGGELDSLRRLGIGLPAFLIAPRVAASSLSVAALTVYAQALLVAGGLGGMALGHDWDIAHALETYLRGMEPGDWVLNVLRSLAFGAAISAVACASGLRARPGAGGVPIATRKSVVGGFAALIAIEIVFSLLTA